MAVSLTKGQTVSLSKQKPGLSSIAMGLGWDMAESGGFFSKLFASGDSIDLDASCVILDGALRMIDACWFRQLQACSGAVRHQGDNLTGEGDGDDEVIEADLDRLPQDAKHLLFLVNSFRGQTFDSVKNAFCRILDRQTGQELARFDLGCQGRSTGQVMACLSRSETGDWTMKAIGAPSQGRIFEEMLPHAVSLIQA